jgi:hypothetical protein
MAKLENKHSGAYMCKVLINTLNEFNITYNIKRLVVFYYYYY